MQMADVFCKKADKVRCSCGRVSKVKRLRYRKSHRFPCGNGCHRTAYYHCRNLQCRKPVVYDRGDRTMILSFPELTQIVV